VASSSFKTRNFRHRKSSAYLVSKVVRKLVHVLMTFLMRRRTTLLDDFAN